MLIRTTGQSVSEDGLAEFRCRQWAERQNERQVCYSEFRLRKDNR